MNRAIVAAVAIYVVALLAAWPSAQPQQMSGPSVPLLHDPSTIPTDARDAARSATNAWRTTPLRALWQHPPYFHDGSAADLLAVVNRYNDDPRFDLGLNERQKADLVEFLISL